MKKYAYVFMAFWFIILSVNVSSKNETEIPYIIYYDQKSSDTYQLKKDVQDIFNELSKGIDEDSYQVMIIDNLSLFNKIDSVEATWSDQRLTIIEGNGKGKFIKGTLKREEICVEQVKPRSWLKEIFE